MFRTCLLGVIDATGGTDEIKWAAFAFLKLPQVLVRLTKSSPASNRSSDLEAGIQMLLTYTPLLDLADIKCGNFDTFANLLSQFGSSKHNLLSEDKIKHFTWLRQQNAHKSKPTEQGTAQQSI